MCGLRCWLVAVVWLCLALPVSAEVFQAKVLSVSKGDSITVLHDGYPEKIRLANVNSPEKDQAYGQKAREFTSGMVLGKQVTVDTTGQDRHAQSFAEVRTDDGKILNEELVKAGLAWWYRKHAPDNTRLAEMEKQARDQHLGLWADPDPVPPWEYRAKQ